MAKKILIVDDDVDSLKLIGLMLQRNGYEVSAANGGAQALAKANKEMPDLIILDVMMPDMNGYEVCRRLRNNDETSTIPIIMFTAKTLIDDKVAGFEAGADDYLTKPTHPAELASRVKSILQRSSNRRQESERGMTIGVLGVKGGVGVTTLTVNIAAALLDGKSKPVVADFRLGNGTLGLSLGMGRSSGMVSLLTKSAEDISSDTIQQELVSHKSDLRLLVSSPNPREALQKVNLEAAQAIVREMRNIGRPAIFDLGAGYSSLVSSVYKEMDRLLIVLDSSGVTLSMARDLMSELTRDEHSKERIRLVVINRSKLNQQPPWHEVETVLGTEISAIISAAPDAAFQALETGTPLIMQHPNAIVSSQITKLAEEISVPTS